MKIVVFSPALTCPSQLGSGASANEGTEGGAEGGGAGIYKGVYDEGERRLERDFERVSDECVYGPVGQIVSEGRVCVCVSE